MKLTVVIEKLYHYLQDHDDLYVKVADLIAIAPDVKENKVRIYIADHFYTMVSEFEFDDAFTLIDTASETIRAALLVKRIQSAG